MVRKRRLGSGLLLLAAALMGACSESGDGVDGAGAGGAGGAGDVGDEACAPRPLEEGCTAGCPSSPDDVQLFCTSDFRTTTRGGTECGGTYVKLDYGLGYTTYYFDANDELVGRVSATDKGSGCMAGNGPITTTFGETCRAIGEAVDLCEDDGGGGAGGDGAGGTGIGGDSGIAGAGGANDQ